MAINMEKSLKDYKNIHKGHKLLLACTGNSLNDVPLPIPIGTWVMTLNRGYLLEGLNPHYLITADKRIEANQNYIDEILKLPVTVFSKNIVGENVINYKLGSKRFSTNAERGVKLGHSVTVVALQLAYYMGFDPVIIVGMNHSISYKNAKRTGIEFQNEGDDENHFIPNYYEKGYKYRYQNLDAVANSYSEARKAFSRDGRRLYNASSQTALLGSIIPRIRLKDVL